MFELLEGRKIMTGFFISSEMTSGYYLFGAERCGHTREGNYDSYVVDQADLWM
jgi:hypothetical protein